MQPVKRRIGDEAPNVETDDMITCCVIRVVAYLSGTVIDAYGAIIE
jgi:hypothetical protein